VSLLDNLNKFAADLRDALVSDGKLVLIGSEGPVEIDAYRGYGNPNRVLIQGRVMRGQQIGKAGETDSTVRNLVNTYKRMRSYPIRHAKVEASIGGSRAEIVADDEGFFRSWMELTSPQGQSSTLIPEWVEVTIRVLEPAEASGAKGTARIRMATPEAAFGVISDLDDTVIQSRVSNFLLAVRTIMLGNARTRLPFPGVAALYQALEKGGDGTRRNPIYYVSSSPWNIHDLISEFLELQGIPVGPICLRDWDVDVNALTSSRLKRHKEPLIREIMDATDPLKFILIGDTSQKDPEIYREIVKAYPGRILATYIRNVDPHPERSAAVQKLADEILKEGSSLVLADDSYAAGKHAAENGWIPVSMLEGIREEKKADEGSAPGKTATPGGGDDPHVPTVVVE
jgi:phosphatidate phosphatase APP1